MRAWRFTAARSGMRVAGESENYGDEQEHLNNVFGARLRITGLRALRGPGSSFSNTWRRATAGQHPTDAERHRPRITTKR